jgi:hypothetical protein
MLDKIVAALQNYIYGDIQISDDINIDTGKWWRDSM